MKHLTDEELRKVRLAGSIVRGLKWIVWLIMLFLVGLTVAAIIIQVNGG